MRVGKVIGDYSWLRRRLAKALGRDELPNKIWEILEKRGSISKYTQQWQQQPLGEPSIRELADEIRPLLELSGDHESASRKRVKMLPQEEITSGKMSPNRAVGISLLLAQEAAKDERVQRFRQDYLGGKLLQPEQMANWILAKKKADGPETWWVEVPVGNPTKIKTEGLLVTRGGPFKISPAWPGFLGEERLLQYGSPDGSWEGAGIPVTYRGTLDRLRVYSELLCRKFGWSEAQATTWILTGLPPLVEAVTSDIQVKEIPCTSRITMTIDPVTSPRAVAEHYRRVRRQVVGDRHRNQGEKHTQLAIFDCFRSAGRPTPSAWRRGTANLGKRKGIDTSGTQILPETVRRLASGCCIPSSASPTPRQNDRTKSECGECQ